MGHSHSHEDAVETEPRPRMRLILTVVVSAIAALTIVGMLLLWPDTEKIPQQTGPYQGEGVSLVSATVTDVAPFDCGGEQQVPNDALQGIVGQCADVHADLADGGTAEFMLDPTAYASANMTAGDHVRLVKLDGEAGAPASFEFYNFERGSQLLWVTLAFVAIVVLIGRWRGFRALCGVVIAVGILVVFVLPAILSGGQPVVVAVVGSTAIMLVVLYLAHGLSIRTTAALFGAMFGIAFTALAGVFTSGWSHLTGMGSEDDWMLLSTAPGLDMRSVVSATMVIAGLGVLNDITITQVSAVWEMRGLNPQSSARRIFRSAMRIGRDHVASSIYTLVFAYAGSMMAVMLLLYTYPQNLLDVLTTEQISQEIVRTLVGAAGLVLAMPVTTWFAIALAPPQEMSERRRARQAAHD